MYLSTLMCYQLCLRFWISLYEESEPTTNWIVCALSIPSGLCQGKEGRLIFVLDIIAGTLLQNLIPAVFWGYTDANSCLDRNWTDWGILLLGLRLQHVISLRACLWGKDSAVMCQCRYNLKSGNMWPPPLPSQTKMQRSPTNIKKICVTSIGCFPAWGEERTWLFSVALTVADVGFFRAVPRPWLARFYCKGLCRQQRLRLVIALQ